MSPEQTEPPARYLTLRDYVRVIRRNALMIAVLAIVGAGAGLGTSVGQTPVYKASSEVALQDPTQELNVVGLGSGPPQTPAELAATNAETLTGAAVMNAVRHRLKTRVSADALAGAISAQVSQSGLLQITASGPNGRSASALANAAASSLVAVDNQQARARFARFASNVQQRIASLPPALRSASPASPLAFYETELARLQTLGSVATSAQIARLAQPTAAASSAHVARSVLIGLALGLLLGIIVAFIRDSMDRRLRDPREIDSSFQLPLLGYVGKRSMGRVAGAQNGTAAKHNADLEQFRILRRNLELLDNDNPPRSILVTSTVAGEGKTTVASSLALAMATAGKRTLLVDCDMRRPALASRLGIDPSPGISDYLLGRSTPEEILRRLDFATTPIANGNGSSTNGHAAGGGQMLVCIPAGSAPPQAAELLGSRRFADFVEQVSKTYDAVVLDSAPLLPVADTLDIVPHVDAVLVCARESRTTRAQAAAARATLGRFPDRPAGVVITGVRSRGAGDELYTYSYAGA